MDILAALEDLKHLIRGRTPLHIQDRLGFHRRKRKLADRVRTNPDIVMIATGNDRRTEGHEWYRGEQVNFMPSRTNLFEKNAIENYVLKGWLPDKPFITKSHYITAFGSCFAQNVTNFLLARGYSVFGKEEKRDSYVIQCGEGMVNSFAVAQQFQWAYGEKEFDESLWFDEVGDEAFYDKAVRDRTRAIFDKTDVFVITLGLSEVWYNKQTNDVFWRAIPRSRFDPSRHEFKVTTVAENLDNLNTIHRIIRQRRPDAAIVFTLSPIPLLATFRPISCVTANSVSKAILRVAVDEFFRAHTDDRRMFYFPSFEIVKDYFDDPFRGDNRHVRAKVLNTIMDNFAKFYLV
jgi:GSCFA family